MGLCTTSVSSQRFEAVSVKWGREECRSIGFVADVAGSLAGDSFDVNKVSESQVESKYLFWLDDSVASAPTAGPGQTLVPVVYTQGDSAATIAGLVQAELDTLLFETEVSGDSVEFRNEFIGAISTEVNTNAPDFTFTQEVVGIGGDLGNTSDGIELSIETTSSELKSNQTGELILGEIQTGMSASVEMSLLEMTQERWETVIGGVTGDIFTPSGGTRLVGGGTSRNSSNLFNLGGKLILHPLALAASDKSFDVTFWRSAPKTSSVTFSGTEPQTLSVNFVAYNDDSKPNEVSLWAQGDWTQSLV